MGNRFARTAAAFGALTASIAIALFVVLYFALLNEQTPQCNGRTHFVCVLEASGATVAAFFGLFAVVGVFTGVAGIAMALSAIRQERVSFETVLKESVYEATHNMQHMANGYKDRLWANWPQLTVSMGGRLLEPSFITQLREMSRGATPGRPLWAHVDHMLRNEDYIRLAAVREAAPSAGLSDILGYFLEHCLRFIIDAARVDPASLRVLQDAGVGDRLLDIANPASKYGRATYWVRMELDQAIADLQKKVKVGTASDEVDEVDQATSVVILWAEPESVSYEQCLRELQSVRKPIADLIVVGQPFERMPDPPARDRVEAMRK